MLRKITFLSGLGVGYVMGTRAGRERYELMRDRFARAKAFARDPKLPKPVHQVYRAAADRFGDSTSEAAPQPRITGAHQIPKAAAMAGKMPASYL